MMSMGWGEVGWWLGGVGIGVGVGVGVGLG